MLTRLNSNIYKSIFTVLIILFPIINQYGSFISGLGLGDILIILLIIVGARFIKFNNNICYYWIFLFYSIFISIFSSFFTNNYSFRDVFFVNIKIIVYAVAFLVYAKQFFDVSLGIKIYKNISLFCSIIVIIQTICYYLIGFTLPNTLPGMVLNYTITNSTEYLIYTKLRLISNFRPYSIFLEPGYVAQYLAPCLLILIFINKSNKYYKLESILLIIGLILTKSTNAFVYLIFIVILKFTYDTFKEKSYKHIFLMYFSIITAIVIIYILYKSNNTYLIEMLDRLREIDIKGSTTSGSTRVIKGFASFAALNWIFKIIGIGFGNYGVFSTEYSIITKFDVGALGSASNSYMSGFTMILVCGGIIGILLYLFSLYKFGVKGETVGKFLTLLLIIMLISSALYTMAIYVLIMSFLIGFNTEYEEKKVKDK